MGFWINWAKSIQKRRLSRKIKKEKKYLIIYNYLFWKAVSIQKNLPNLSPNESIATFPPILKAIAFTLLKNCGDTNMIFYIMFFASFTSSTNSFGFGSFPWISIEFALSYIFCKISPRWMKHHINALCSYGFLKYL